MLARSLPTFKEGTFLPTKARTLCIVALCVVWAIALYAALYPIGNHFIHTRTQEAIAAYLTEHGQAATASFEDLSFLDTCWLAIRGLLWENPLFLTLWLLATAVNATRLLRKQSALPWLSCMLALLFFGQTLLAPHPVASKERQLFVPESALVAEMPSSVEAQREVLEKAWIQYRDAHFTSPTDNSEVNFNIARLKAMQEDGPISYAGFRSTYLAGFILLLSLLLALVRPDWTA